MRKIPIPPIPLEKRLESQYYNMDQFSKLKEGLLVDYYFHVIVGLINQYAAFSERPQMLAKAEHQYLAAKSRMQETKVRVLYS